MLKMTRIKKILLERKNGLSTSNQFKEHVQEQDSKNDLLILKQFRECLKEEDHKKVHDYIMECNDKKITTPVDDFLFYGSLTAHLSKINPSNDEIYDVLLYITPICPDIVNDFVEMFVKNNMDYNSIMDIMLSYKRWHFKRKWRKNTFNVLGNAILQSNNYETIAQAYNYFANQRDMDFNYYDSEVYGEFLESAKAFVQNKNNYNDYLKLPVTENYFGRKILYPFNDSEIEYPTGEYWDLTAQTGLVADHLFVVNSEKRKIKTIKRFWQCG